MVNSLLEKYSNYHPEFLESLEVFSEMDKARIIRSLKNETNKTNFLSKICEVKFGHFFIDLGFEVAHERPFPNTQKPDWRFFIDDAMAICDVYRLGTSERDQIRSDFEHELMEKLEEINLSYFLRIQFKEEYFETTAYDIDSIVNRINEWLYSSNKVVGEGITVDDNFEFEIIKTDTGVEHVCCIGNANSIEIKPQKLKQLDNLKPNEITKKLNKYDELISQYKLPYFLCVYIDFESGFGDREFRDYFLGGGVQFIDFGKPIADHPQFNHLGQQWTDLGVFYNNLQLSGVITFMNGKFSVLLNPQKQQILYTAQHSAILERLEKHKMASDDL